MAPDNIDFHVTKVCVVVSCIYFFAFILLIFLNVLNNSNVHILIILMNTGTCTIYESE